ncbi:MAG: hypothetical protein Q8P18_10260 [Pseudomonadota bacterium]|nr:hypothetical protein [Pseudomonadota bacterium]
MRIYHPDYRISWWDRFLDPAGTHARVVRPVGVDYTLLNRSAARAVRGFLEETLNLYLLGDEMVRIDSAWRLPPSPEARGELIPAIALRLRFAQLHPGTVKVPVALRWLDFQDAPHGTSLFLRLLDRPNPGLRSFVDADLSEDGSGGWEEYALGSD